MIEPTIRMMCQLNCLFDFRLSALLLSQTDDFIKSIDTNRYLDRASDDFSKLACGFDKESYNEIISSNSLELFKNSNLTSLCFFLAAIKDKSLTLPKDSYITKVDFTLNTYPYDIVDGPRDLIRDQILGLLPEGSTVEFIKKPIADLHPEYIKDNFDNFFLYEHSEWLWLFYKDILEKPLAKVTINTPTLEINSLDKNSKEYKAIEGINYFKFYEQCTSEFYKLVFNDTRMFSIISKKFVRQKKRT